jgi:hypothetical protein
VPEGVEIPELAQGPEHDQAIVWVCFLQLQTNMNLFNCTREQPSNSCRPPQSKADGQGNRKVPSIVLHRWNLVTSTLTVEKFNAIAVPSSSSVCWNLGTA